VTDCRKYPRSVKKEINAEHSMLIGMQDLTANKLSGHLFLLFAILEKSLYNTEKEKMKMEINENENELILKYKHYLSRIRAVDKNTAD
jgi:hypothetical protein